MANEGVLAWDRRVCAANETGALGTVPDLAGSQAIECIVCDLGPAEQAEVRPKKDKTQGRGMTSAFVAGRVQPITFNLQKSVMSRAAVDTTPKEAVLYQAAGMRQTTNASTSVVYDFISNPSRYSIALYRTLGTDSTTYEAEWLRGGIVKQLKWSGGDKELTLDVNGQGIGKYHSGYIASITLADGVGTTMTVSAEESYRLTTGMFMQIESEIIKIGAFTYGGTSVTIERAQLSSSGAAHTAQPLRPYYPTLTLAGSPISEADTTVTIAGTAFRCLSFEVTLETGVDHLPGESGSKYIQGVAFGRYSVKGAVKVKLQREMVSWLGKIRDRTAIAMTIACGTGAGSIATFSLPYTEMEPFAVPDTDKDTVLVDINFRCRDNSGNDMFALTLT